MSYYLAQALVELRTEINKAYPKRDHRSDGWIGDPSHAARKSDHNPDYSDGGIVRAIDVDKDGIDPNHLVQLAIKDPRTNYVIFNGYIYSRAYGFKKRVYTGVNKHEHHVHISILKAHEHVVTSWHYAAALPPKPVVHVVAHPKPPVAPRFPLPPGYYFGPKEGPAQSISGYRSHRADLQRWQAQMIVRGWKFGDSRADGLWGPDTLRVVRAFRAEKNLGTGDRIDARLWAAAWTAPRT